MIKVIGAGLAGAEAAYFLASHGVETELVDMKPQKYTPAHTNSNFCELVCSNSLKSNDVEGNACGLLKEEMRRMGSLTMRAAEETKVPAGGALAVDREAFSAYVTRELRALPALHIVCREECELPEQGIVATGPLTSDDLSEAIVRKFGDTLHFYDATAPVVTAESIDYTHAFVGDRYGKGTGDYINCPMSKEEYDTFLDALLAAERVTLRDFEKREIFEGCMPVEVMAARGRETLAYGPLKPVGLSDAYAVLQLRRENAAGTHYGLVGFQTNLKFAEQKRVFSLIPALRHAEFERYGVMHRNTFLQSPAILNADFSVKEQPMLFFAGQITGVEGYVESAASGLLSAIHLYAKLRSKPARLPSAASVSGALSEYIATPNKHFQPMNANYGILAPLGKIKDKKEKKRLYAVRALEEIERFYAAAVSEEE